jgi:lipoprotein-releasing system ATP-binding protein
MSLLETHNLAKTYYDVGHPIRVLSGVDLTVERGDMVGIVGESGSGKSTLLYVLGALELPNEGEVLYDGKAVLGPKTSLRTDAARAAFRNKTIGFVFQFHGLIPEFDTLENAMMPALIAGVPRAKAAKKAIERLEGLGLGERLTHKPGELSGGEQQRVAFARALVMDPALILADEPTGNLDTATGERLWDMMFTINETWNTAFIVVTHNERLARRLPRLYRLREGVLEEAQ